MRIGEAHHQDLAVLSDRFPTVLRHLHTGHLTIGDSLTGDHDRDPQLQLSHQRSFGEMRPEDGIVTGVFLDGRAGERGDQFMGDESGFGNHLPVKLDRGGLSSVY